MSPALGAGWSLSLSHGWNLYEFRGTIVSPVADSISEFFDLSSERSGNRNFVLPHAQPSPSMPADFAIFA
jgi:hypothetical protein